MAIAWPANALCSPSQVRGWVDQSRTGADSLADAYRGNLDDATVVPVIGAVSARMENACNRSLALVEDGDVWVRPPRQRRRSLDERLVSGSLGYGSYSVSPVYSASGRPVHLNLMERGKFPLWSVSAVQVEHSDGSTTDLAAYPDASSGYWLRDSDRASGRLTLVDVDYADGDVFKVTCTYGFYAYGADGTLSLPDNDDGTAAAAAYELSAAAMAWAALLLTARVPDEGKSVDGAPVLAREYPIPTRVKATLDQGYRRSPL